MRLFLRFPGWLYGIALAVLFALAQPDSLQAVEAIRMEPGDSLEFADYYMKLVGYVESHESGVEKLATEAEVVRGWNVDVGILVLWVDKKSQKIARMEFYVPVDPADPAGKVYHFPVVSYNITWRKMGITLPSLPGPKEADLHMEGSTFESTVQMMKETGCQEIPVPAKTAPQGFPAKSWKVGDAIISVIGAGKKGDTGIRKTLFQIPGKIAGSVLCSYKIAWYYPTQGRLGIYSRKPEPEPEPKKTVKRKHAT